MYTAYLLYRVLQEGAERREQVLFRLVSTNLYLQDVEGVLDGVIVR